VKTSGVEVKQHCTDKSKHISPEVMHFLKNGGSPPQQEAALLEEHGGQRRRTALKGAADDGKRAFPL
jgi:hypothetical protein